MVKKLQAFRANKGFTLVELIVVIAIIGVLAAILVPTMMGMVTKARVTSADQTASSLAQTVVTWLSDLESNGRTIPTGKIAVKISGKCGDADSNGNVSTWTITTQSTFSGSGTPATSSSSSGDSFVIKAANDSDGSKAKKKLVNKINDDYNFNNSITAVVWVNSRKVVGCAYCDSAVDVDTLVSTFGVDQFKAQAYNWGKTDGVFEGDGGLSGKIIGTNPKLLIDNLT